MRYYIKKPFSMETKAETELRLPQVGQLVILKKIKTKPNQKSCIRVGRRRQGVLNFPIEEGGRVRFKLSIRGGGNVTSVIEKIYEENGKLHIETVSSIYEITF